MQKRSGKWLKVSGSLSRAAALDVGATISKKTLGASFKIVPSNIAPSTAKPTGAFSALRKYFRTYAIRKGRRIALKDTFIEKRGARLTTRNEILAIQRARTQKFLGKRSRWLR